MNVVPQTIANRHVPVFPAIYPGCKFEQSLPPKPVVDLGEGPGGQAPLILGENKKK